MNIAVLRETLAGELRVALMPESVKELIADPGSFTGVPSGQVIKKPRCATSFISLSYATDKLRHVALAGRFINIRESR